MSRANQCPPPRIPPPLAGRAGSWIHHPSHWLWKPPCESPVTGLTAECGARKLLANCLLPAALPARLPRALEASPLVAPPFPLVIIQRTCWDHSNHCAACSETQPSKVRGRLLAFGSISPSLASRAIRDVVCASGGAGGCFSRNQAEPSRSRAGLASQISCSVQISIVQNKVREGEAGEEMERPFRPAPCGGPGTSPWQRPGKALGRPRPGAHCPHPAPRGAGRLPPLPASHIFLSKAAGKWVPTSINIQDSSHSLTFQNGPTAAISHNKSRR